MKRKRWTAKTEVTPAVLKFREKRKWQIALRRYLLAPNSSSFYAPYFGLDAENFRKWIALQFTADMNWDNFSENWQLDHIIPVTYFDFEQEADLKLCWNFINITTERIDPGATGENKLDVFSAKAWFASLHQQTGYSPCLDMVKKIEQIENARAAHADALEDFIRQNKQYLDTISTFNEYEYKHLNTGTGLKNILAEREIMKKFG